MLEMDLQRCLNLEISGYGVTAGFKLNIEA
jgi:hypothetical protein